MNIVISGRHTSLREGEKRVIEEKLQKFDRKVTGITKTEVILNVENNRHDIEIILHVAKSNPLIANASAQDNLAALDVGIQKLDNLVSKHNGKLHEHHK